MNSRQAKQIRIDEYLARLGYSPKSVGDKRIIYTSMLAPNGETSPSFQVSPDGRAFHDWSTGASGSIIDLAMWILRNPSVSAALAHIEKTIGVTTYSTRPSSFYQQKPSIEILSIDDLKSPALLSYARRRGISVSVLKHYCFEVQYRTTLGKTYYSIGWQNNAGGWELRNQFSKVAIQPKDITIVNDLCDCTILIFEGFFDFLSAVTLEWFQPMEMNAIILNSTAMLKRAFPIIKHAKKVICLLDNDDSGRKATSDILKICATSEDYSHIYANFNDINDYLLAMNNSNNK